MSSSVDVEYIHGDEAWDIANSEHPFLKVSDASHQLKIPQLEGSQIPFLHG